MGDRTDEQIVNRAVELADGWCLHPRYNDCAVLNTHRGEVYLEDQYILDALAAQLVRQVDKEFEASWSITGKYVHLFGPKGQIITIEGPDRTMNTLRAIVESGVLEPTDD